mmetsp:Transcript_20513/g.35263  ORF Transcript_20513/g.35263 Transcript_20513/m.35263 type:complete len:286 (+) Transcript_20513:503-1360(+)
MEGRREGAVAVRRLELKDGVVEHVRGYDGVEGARMRMEHRQLVEDLSGRVARRGKGHQLAGVVTEAHGQVGSLDADDAGDDGVGGAGAEDGVDGDAVEVEVELRVLVRPRVAGAADRAAHDDHLLRVCEEQRVGLDAGGDVGERPEAEKGDLVGVGAKEGHEELGGQGLGGGVWWRHEGQLQGFAGGGAGVLVVFHPRLVEDIRLAVELCVWQRLLGAHADRDGQGEVVEEIREGFRTARARHDAVYRRDTDDVDGLGGAKEADGVDVVEAAVRVDDNSGLHQTV